MYVNKIYITWNLLTSYNLFPITPLSSTHWPFYSSEIPSYIPLARKPFPFLKSLIISIC